TRAVSVRKGTDAESVAGTRSQVCLFAVSEQTGAAYRLVSTSVSEDQAPTDISSRDESFAWGSRRGETPTYCGWCGKQVEQGPNTGRKRQYCGQSCRQRAYERRIAVERGGLP